MKHETWYLKYPFFSRVSCPVSRVSSSRGFTLIELMVVISIIALLAGFGVAAFSKFNQTQTLQQAANDLENNLRLAQSKASAQEKPSESEGCGVLDGYRVDIGISSYSVVALCDGRNPLEASRKYFPSLVSSISLSPAQVDFYLLGGGATGATISVSGFGRTPLTVTVTRTGEIY